ncbi:MAG: efflux RND transporter permease subunit [Candidatus Latescibacteria bacterium]|nr:efflux RND transporter permease subunit [Candidatus Latescibacterota bacterium]
MHDNKYPLPRFSVNRPVTVVMSLVSLLVVGYIAYTRIPLTLLPEGLNWPQLFVWVSYPNAGAVEVEQKVVHHLEEAIAQVNRVKTIYANASSNSCFLRVEFQRGTDVQLAFAEMKDRLDRVMPDLPDEIEQIGVRRWNQNDVPIMQGAFVFAGDQVDAPLLIENYLDPALSRVTGVGNVQLWGLQSKEVLVELDQGKVRGHGVNVSETVSSLRDQNLTMPGGWVIEGGKKIYVRSVGRYQDLAEIAGTVVDPERRLQLDDIGEVAYKRPKKDEINRIDRSESQGFSVIKASGANVVEVSRGVQQAMEKLKAHPKLEGLDFRVFWDQGEQVVKSVYNLQNSGLWGGLFAAIVLFFFLRAVRITMIITLAIPLSILVTITVLYFIGWSLNMATMMGLMLSLGLVVDNAIVIVENIYHKRQQGIDPRTASIEGAGEVGLAVTMATLTTVVVFLPLILMGDVEELSFWMLRLGLPVIVGLVASLAIALLFIPLATLKLATGEQKGEPRLIVWCRKYYVRSLAWVLRNRLDAFVIALLLLASIQIPMNGMMRTDKQERDESQLVFSFEMPSGQSLEEAEEYMLAVEDTLMAHKANYNVEWLRTSFSSEQGQVMLFFAEEEELEWYQVAWHDLSMSIGWREQGYLAYKEVEQDIRRRLEIPPGVSLQVNRENAEQDARVNVTLYGEDTRVLMGLAEEVERRIESIPGLLSVNTDMDRGGTELQVRLDREQVQRYEVNPWEISNTISYALRGVNVNKFHTEDGREVDIRVQFESYADQNLQDLRNMTFSTAADHEVPLESLADIYVERTLGGIKRENRRTMLTVSARASKDSAQELFAQIDQAMQGFEMPRGYNWDKGDRFVRLEEQNESMKFAVMMSVIFVFLLMGMLFESFVLPLSVIVSIPFSFLGVYWVLYLTGTPFEVMSMIGSIILIGVVVNNAIVLVDLANRLRAGGKSRFDALLEAGQHRFRPILMTTFTTAFGLLPMAVGNSKMIGIAYAPLGRTMMGGLLASMVLTLMLVPLFYTFFDDFREVAQRIMASAFGRRRK